MKVLFIISTFLLIHQLAHAQLKQPKFKGKVKSTTVYIYDTNLDSPDRKYWGFKSKNDYTPSGSIMSSINFMRKSTKSKYFETIREFYNTDGKILKSYIGNDPASGFSYNYSHDSLKRTVVKGYDKKQLFSLSLIDEKSGVDTNYQYDSNKVTSKSIYHYNKDKLIYYITKFNGDGSINYRSIDTYDNQNRRIDEVVFKNGKRESHETYNYRKYGYTRIDSNKSYTGGPPASKIISDKIYSLIYRYKLDGHGNPIVTSLLHDGKYVVMEVCKYKYY